MSRQFDTGLGWFWSARHSQIYPELRRMTQMGLITRDPDMAGENLEKFTYRITEEGRSVLTEWVNSPPVYPPNRDVERLQLIFADDAPEALRAHLEAHREHHERHCRRLREILDAIESGEHERINLRLRNRPEETRNLTLGLRVLAYSGDLERAQLEVRWAERALAWLDAREAAVSPEVKGG